MIKTKQRNITNKQLKAFTLVEISLVLLIIGIIAGGLTKGKHLIESARLKSVSTDIQNIQLSYNEYVSTYGALPGDDKEAQLKFGKTVQNGNGDCKISGEDIKKFWSHLFAANLIDSETFVKPKIGGSYDIVFENGAAKIRLSENGEPFLTGKQAVSLKSKLIETPSIDIDSVEIYPNNIETSSNQLYMIKVKLK